MLHSHVNIAKLIPCSCNRLVSSVYLPSTWAYFVYPPNPRSHQTSSGVCLTAGEPPDKHRSVWLDSSGLHSSSAQTLRSRCDKYVCWSYYKPSGNQWAGTHLGAHPLVISLISLLALAIWALSPGQWLSEQRDWSSSSYRSLINGCGWGNGSFLFPSLFFSFSFLWCWGLMYVMFPWGAADDWHEPPGRQADWLAGSSSPTSGLTRRNTHTLLFSQLSVQRQLKLQSHYGAILHYKCAVRQTQLINDIRKSSTTSSSLGRYCWFIIDTCIDTYIFSFFMRGIRNAWTEDL